MPHDSGAENDESQSDWRSWLDQLGQLVHRYLSGQRFSNSDPPMEAAIGGIGVGLGRPIPLAIPTAYLYYVVALPETISLPVVPLAACRGRGHAVSGAPAACREARTGMRAH